MSLLEALLACTILTVGVLSLAHLFALSAGLNASSRRATIAAVLAAQKLEMLRTAPLAPSPRTAELLTADDREWVREWAMTPLAADPDHTFVVHVRVGRALSGGNQQSWDAQMLTLRSRRAP